MNILVTGANGYLGLGIVKALLDLGNEVIATDLYTDSIDKRANKINSDIFGIYDFGSIFGCPDALLHLAWRNGFKHDDNSHLEDLPKHYSFINKAIDAGVTDITVMGSMHEVGFFEGSIDENTPCHPMNLYGVSKNALREAAQQLCIRNNIFFRWLRGFYIVGDSLNGSSIFSKIAQAEKDGKREFPFTMGKN